MSFDIRKAYPIFSEPQGHGCGFCAYAGEGGRCAHPRHARFQREPNMRCRLYRYEGDGHGRR